MGRARTITSREQLVALRTMLERTAEHARNQLRNIVDDPAPLFRLKFERLGCDPLDFEDAQNLAEQIDQQATYEAAVDALEHLMNAHPGETWTFAPGAHGAGHDITNTGGTIVAEVFAAVRPDNNGKLKKDLAKVRASTAIRRYIFFRSPARGRSSTSDGDVTIVSLGLRGR